MAEKDDFAAVWLSKYPANVTICSVVRVVRARGGYKLHCLCYELSEAGGYNAMLLSTQGAQVVVHSNHVLISGFTLDHLGRLPPGISEIINEIVLEQPIVL